MDTSLTQTKALDANNVVLLLGRVCLSVLFLWGGSMKLISYGAFVGYLTGKGVPAPTFFALPAIASELVGGLMLALGIQTRFVAAYLALYTLFTAFVGHPFWTFTDPKVRYDMTIHFWKNIAIVGGFLSVAAAGAGKIRVGTKSTRKE
ncbi:DoxX family protein [Paraburkholderia caribensis]|uniref:DoxX family protein n=1 Tax=Paraburkholderia caribensis TaxID=75105 RepID=UPI00158FF8B6|nr:DoxX family protein [Paraburkholderia caribensis]